MNGAFYIGATGLRAQERALGVTANNIANLNTPGFKRSQVRFGELMAAPSQAGTSSNQASGVAGVASARAASIFEQGELRETANPLDLAIDGDGFVEVLGPDGQRLLWRGGTLSIQPDGLLATADGLKLHALISVPEDASDLRVGRDGIVSAQIPQDGLVELGKIDLIDVRDPAALEAMGRGIYRPASGGDLAVDVPGEDGAGAIVQGSIEASNVALSNEMVALLLMQRAYAASAQALQAGDQLMGIANGLRR